MNIIDRSLLLVHPNASSLSRANRDGLALEVAAGEGRGEGTTRGARSASLSATFFRARSLVCFEPLIAGTKGVSRNPVNVRRWSHAP
jgi:hypothetical protein